MRNFFIILFVLQLALNCNGQNKKNIVCTYKILVQDFTLEELNKITDDQNVRSNIVNRLEESKKRILNLHGNHENAFFYESDKMRNDAIPSKYQSDPLDNYYYNNYGKEIIMNTFINKEFFVKIPVDKYSWVITDESKIIDGYQCYKATGIHEVNDFRGKKNYTINAWFCPTLPFNYGPAEFFGLPGLIFEAYYENAKEKYVLQSIKFPDELIVPIVGNKEIISEAEFTDNFNKMMENMGN